MRSHRAVEEVPVLDELRVAEIGCGGGKPLGACLVPGDAEGWDWAGEGADAQGSVADVDAQAEVTPLPFDKRVWVSSCK